MQAAAVTRLCGRAAEGSSSNSQSSRDVSRSAQGGGRSTGKRVREACKLIGRRLNQRRRSNWPIAISSLCTFALPPPPPAPAAFAAVDRQRCDHQCCRGRLACCATQARASTACSRVGCGQVRVGGRLSARKSSRANTQLPSRFNFENCKRHK